MTCCYDMSDMPKVFNAKEIVARKQHTCCECGRTVRIGDVYENATGLWDDHWQTFKTCERCSDIRASVEASICVEFGELYDAYEYLVGTEVANKVFDRSNVT